jgi:zinc transport system ATP-binding protein
MNKRPCNRLSGGTAIGFQFNREDESPIASLMDVDFSYNGQPVLSHVCLEIYPHDFIALIGPNGGGKTTLLKLILGLVRPDRGSVRVLDRSGGAYSPAIGYVPQNVNFNEDFPITAMDVVLMGTLDPDRSRRGKKKDNMDKAMGLLERLGIGSLAYQKIGEMSGGQRQRVLIARSLMTRPRLLLLDEPTASIDTKGQADFYKLLEELNKDVAILVVSHDLFIVSNYVKSVACVNKGLHYHPHEEITGNMIETMYSCSVEDVCRVQVLAHGMPKPDRQAAGGQTHGNI